MEPNKTIPHQRQQRCEETEEINDTKDNLQLDSYSQNDHLNQLLPSNLKDNAMMLTKQKKFAQQRSILKNSQDHTLDELHMMDVKKQIILRRRRLFSHYRQYEQWRRKQFSCDPSYFRPQPPAYGHATHGALHRRRQYRRQYSCNERSREDSHESRDSSSARNYRNTLGSDYLYTESSLNNRTERSLEGSECGALAYQPFQLNSRFNMLQEEHLTANSERWTRSRINSAIFVSSEGKGFDSVEFLRRHGSQSVLCRKAKSAENITDSERKKKDQKQRRWQTEESTEAINEEKGSKVVEMEFQQRRSSHQTDTRTLSVRNSYKEHQVLDMSFGTGRSAAVTTSNIVIGSISIETPPAHFKSDNVGAENSKDQPKHPFIKDYNAKASASRDSTDTMEEFIMIPSKNRSTALVHQQSSTSTNKSQSPSMSPHNSPRSLTSKGIKQKINILPMVSVSEPSPPHDGSPHSESL